MSKLLTLFLLVLASTIGVSAHAQVLLESLRQFSGLPPFSHGYNRTHIVRRGDTVYLLYNVNSSCLDGLGRTVGNTTIFKKVGDGPWTYGETFPFNDAGLMVDPQGLVRVFGYWNGDPNPLIPCQPNNKSGGIRLWTSIAPGAVGSGQWTQEWVQQPPANPNANIPKATGRLGGGVDVWGNLYIADGIAEDAVWGWIKASGGSSWQKQQLFPTPGAGNLYAYPYVQPFAPFAGFFSTLNLRDDQYDTSMLLYPRGDWTWGETKVDDWRVKQRIVKQHDTYVDSQGQLHVLDKVCNTDGSNCGYNHWVYPIVTGPNVPPANQTYAANPVLPPQGFVSDLVRLIEIDGRMFYVAAGGTNTIDPNNDQITDAKIYFKEASQVNSNPPDYGWREIPIPQNIDPTHPNGTSFASVTLYVSAPRGGGDVATQYVDILAMDGQFRSNGLALYARIPVSVMLAP
jgi:hypothetical protein